jgi:fido (protein-threonine AMPylation protein)
MQTIGKLYIVIPELKRLGYIEVLTHSKWDIIELHRNLQAVYNFAGDLRTVPFILSRSPREIKIPLNGRRVKQIKHLLNIEINPNYTQQVIEQKELKRIEQSYEQ